MLRLTVISQNVREVVLKVDGSLGGADVNILEQEGGYPLHRPARTGSVAAMVGGAVGTAGWVFVCADAIEGLWADLGGYKQEAFESSNGRQWI